MLGKLWQCEFLWVSPPDDTPGTRWLLKRLAVKEKWRFPSYKCGSSRWRLYFFADYFLESALVTRVPEFLLLAVPSGTVSWQRYIRIIMFCSQRARFLEIWLKINKIQVYRDPVQFYNNIEKNVGLSFVQTCISRSLRLHIIKKLKRKVIFRKKKWNLFQFNREL